MFICHVIVNKLYDSKTKTVRIKYIFFIAKIQNIIAFFAFDKRNFIMITIVIAKRF